MKHLLIKTYRLLLLFIIEKSDFSDNKFNDNA
jgi:hypothetical protein